MAASFQPENLNLSFHFLHHPVKKDLSKDRKEQSKSETETETSENQIRMGQWNNYNTADVTWQVNVYFIQHSKELDFLQVFWKIRQTCQNREPPSTLLTLSHMLSSVPDTNSTCMCSGSPLRSSLRCLWACVCPGGCRGKDRQMMPCTASSDPSLSCLAKAAAARLPIDLPADSVHLTSQNSDTWGDCSYYCCRDYLQ